MLFDCQASGELIFDMHSEQDGVDPYQYAPTFDKGNASGARGSYTAPFFGIHGWFWENRNMQDVTLEISTAGFYSAATEFRQNYMNEKRFTESE